MSVPNFLRLLAFEEGPGVTPRAQEVTVTKHKRQQKNRWTIPWSSFGSTGVVTYP